MKSGQARDAQGTNDGQVHAPALPLEKKKIYNVQSESPLEECEREGRMPDENSGFGIRKRTLQLIATPAVQSLA